jgi:hypothetical protein
VKRILLQHTYGHLAGLTQIVGLYPDGRPVLPLLTDANGSAVLAKVEPRYVLYTTRPTAPGGADPKGPAAMPEVS